MRKARSLVLTLAAVAAVAAVMLVRHTGPREPHEPRAADTVEVLVAVRPISAGETIGPADVRWQPWPKQALLAGSVQHTPGVAFSFDPAPARFPILQGEPIVESKLVRPGTGGAMALLLAAGMRAMPVPIREETAAANFIQPQDHVDVMLVRKLREGVNTPAKGEILIRNVRVLAISKAPEGRGGGSSQGRTATLELTPAQARRLLSAQGAGDISLALVAAADGTAGVQQQDDAERGGEAEPQPVRMMKFGRRQ